MIIYEAAPMVACQQLDTVCTDDTRYLPDIIDRAARAGRQAAERSGLPYGLYTVVVVMHSQACGVGCLTDTAEVDMGTCQVHSVHSVIRAANNPQLQPDTPS